MVEDPYRGDTRNFPADWWQQLEFSRRTLCELGRHVVGLRVSAEVEGLLQHGIYTGCAVEFPGGGGCWVTAGHVIDDPSTCLRRIYTDLRVKILRSRWLDECEIRGAQSLPTDLQGLKMFSVSEPDVDFGVVMMPELDVKSIRKSSVEFMNAGMWKNLPLAKPEGYHLIGYPSEWFDVWENALSDGQVKEWTAAIRACLPVRRMAPGAAELEELGWNDPRLFYGEILPYSDTSGEIGTFPCQPKSIRGMSGGPLFSIERDADGKHIRYYLVGIQSRWREKKRYIVVEPMLRVLNKLREQYSGSARGTAANRLSS